MLENNLDSRQYIIFKDVLLPTEEGTTQIDHLVFSKFGVFVIETKNLRHWIFANNGPSWTQVIFNHKSKFQNPVRQNFLHVKTVASITGLEIDKIINLVVFAGSCEFKTEIPKECVRLKRVIAKIKSFENDLIEPTRLLGSINAITTSRIENTFENKARHINYLNRKNARNNYFLDKKRPVLFEYLFRVGLKLIYPLLFLVMFFVFIGLFFEQSIKVISDIGKNNILYQESFKSKQNKKNYNQQHLVVPQFIQPFSYKSTATINDNHGTSKDSISNSQKNKSALYSWTNERGQKAYSNVGFPQDKTYTDPKIEWK